MSEVRDLSDVELVPEGDIAVASSDYVEVDFAIVEPGKYTSRFRKIQVPEPTRDVDGNYKFRVNFNDGGLEDSAGNSIQYPPSAFLSTKLYDVNRGTGKVSSVGRYLDAFEVPVSSLASITDIRKALLESQNVPIGVLISWEDDYLERQSGEKAKKTSFFKVGDRYVPVVKVGDRIYKARARVDRFFKL